jgi:MFS family permease
MRTFYTIWCGQVLSTLGSNLTAFAVGLWLYQKTGSATMYSLYMFCAILPGVCVSPFLGALVDRLDRRTAMIIADAGAGFFIVMLAMVISADAMQAWHLFVLSAMNAVFSALQWPAYSASTSLMVPKEKLAQASGLVQLSQGLAQILAPIMGGVLIVAIGLKGILLFDFITYAFAIGTLLLVRFPAVPASQEGVAARGSLIQEAGFGFRYLKKRPGLLRLLFFFAGVNFFLGIIYALATPAIMLGFNNDTVILGVLLSVGGVGMLLGSVGISIWGGPRRLIYGILGFSLLMGIGIFCIGLKPVSPVLIGFFIFLILFASPLIAGCNQAIWQKKVPYDIQGKVFGVRQAIATSSIPLAYLVAGPLADRLFGPFMNSNGSATNLIARITGSGPGAGIRLMFIIVGILMFLMVFLAFKSKPMLNVEAILPDADLMMLEEERIAK